MENGIAVPQKKKEKKLPHGPVMRRWWSKGTDLIMEDE